VALTIAGIALVKGAEQERERRERIQRERQERARALNWDKGQFSVERRSTVMTLKSLWEHNKWDASLLCERRRPLGLA